MESLTLNTLFGDYIYHFFAISQHHFLSHSSVCQLLIYNDNIKRFYDKYNIIINLNDVTSNENGHKKDSLSCPWLPHVGVFAECRLSSNSSQLRGCKCESGTVVRLLRVMCQVIRVNGVGAGVNQATWTAIKASPWTATISPLKKPSEQHH